MNYLSGQPAKVGDTVAIGMDNGSRLIIGTVTGICAKKIKIDGGEAWSGNLYRDPERVVLVSAPQQLSPVALTSDQIVDLYAVALDGDFDNKFNKGYTITRDKFLQLFHEHATTIYAHSREVDEAEEQDWYSIALGFALAKGLTPTEAHEYAIIERYSTNLSYMYQDDEE